MTDKIKRDIRRCQKTQSAFGALSYDVPVSHVVQFMTNVVSMMGFILFYIINWHSWL